MSSSANASMPSHPILPVSVLDVFLPGLTHAATIAEQLLTGELNRYAYTLCLIGVFVYLCKYIGRLSSWMEPYLTTTIHVRLTDEPFHILLVWVRAHGIASQSRSSRVSISKDQKVGETPKKVLEYVPWTGSFWFWYQNRPIYYRTGLINLGFTREEQISLTCLGRSSQPLKNLMDECLREYQARSEKKTAIFEHEGERWARKTSRNSRPLSTVILNEKVKKSLVDDLKNFLEPHTRLWYTQKSMAYRRGYLLSGPPGTGKSSLCFSIAGELDLDVYIVSIPSVSDRTLKALFDGLPERCIVLLEDIDAAGISRLKSETDNSKKSIGLQKPQEVLTLFGLLDNLDGVSSPEGRVVMMTTNYAERLDEALIRPGRIDRRIQFELADEDVIRQLFSFVYMQPGDGEGVVDSSTIKVQSAQFAKSVPPSAFSQAELLSYLMQYKDQPDEALRDCQEWVDVALQRKTA